MNEELTNPDAGEQGGEVTIEQIIEACRSVLPPEDLEDLAQMDPEEATTYLLSWLPEFGIDDPEAFVSQIGLVEKIIPLTSEKLAARNTEAVYFVAETDAKDMNQPKTE